MVSMMFGSWEVSRMLLDAGADPTARDCTGCDALMLAASSGRAASVAAWLARFPGWRLRRSDYLGRTALHFAVGFGSGKMAVTKVLLEAGADAWARARSGTTPLHSACSNASADAAVVTALLNWPGAPGAASWSKCRRLGCAMARHHGLTRRHPKA